MSINVFGQPLSDKHSAAARGPPGVGFNLTENGDYDLKYKRLCFVSAPMDKTDSDNLDTLNKSIDLLKTQYESVLEKKFQEKSTYFLNTVLADIRADQLLSVREEYIKTFKNQLDWLKDQSDIVTLETLNTTTNHLEKQFDATVEKKFEEKSVQFLNTVLADIKADQFLTMREEYSKILNNQLDSRVRKIIDEKLELLNNRVDRKEFTESLSKIIDQKIDHFAETRLQSALSVKSREHTATALAALRADKVWKAVQTSDQNVSTSKGRSRRAA